MYKQILIIAIALTLPIKGKSDDLHLNLPQKAQEVLSQKPNGLSLKQVNEAVLKDQLDVKISYEKLLQAQRKIGLARAQYFPYGVGTVATMYFLNVFSPVLLVELFTSLPSKIFYVQSEKNMKQAQVYSHKALKENIKNQIAHLYYGILKEESALKLARMELRLLETLYQATEDKVLVGLSTEADLRSIELRILDLRDICLKFASYLSEEKFAFNTMISEDAITAKKLELQPVSDFLNPSDYQLSAETIRNKTINQSYELTAADYMIKAAKNSRKSAEWSILSFSGIGFGYWSKVKIEGSKVSQAQIKRQQVETTLANQSYVVNNSYHRTLDHFESEKKMFADASFYYESELSRFQDNHIPLDQLAEAGILFLKDYNELVVAHYDSLIKLNDLERLVLDSVHESSSRGSDNQVVFNQLNKNKYALSLKKNNDIESVEYIFDRKTLKGSKVTNRSTNFRYTLKLVNKRELSGHVNVLKKNGQIITYEFDFL